MGRIRAGSARRLEPYRRTRRSRAGRQSFAARSGAHRRGVAPLFHVHSGGQSHQIPIGAERGGREVSRLAAASAPRLRRQLQLRHGNV